MVCKELLRKLENLLFPMLQILLEHWTNADIRMFRKQVITSTIPEFGKISDKFFRLYQEKIKLYAMEQTNINRLQAAVICTGPDASFEEKSEFAKESMRYSFLMQDRHDKHKLHGLIVVSSAVVFCSGIKHIGKFLTKLYVQRQKTSRIKALLGFFRIYFIYPKSKNKSSCSTNGERREQVYHVQYAKRAGGKSALYL